MSSLTTFINRIPEVFETSGEVLYKARNEVRLFVVEGKEVVVKRFKRPNLTQCIAYSFFGPNKAQKAVQYAARLNELGIPTPAALGEVTIRPGILVKQYYLATLACHWPDCRVLREWTDDKATLLHDLVSFIIYMHERGFLHGDTNLSNFLYAERAAVTDPASPLYDAEAPVWTGGQQYTFQVIDINRSRFTAGPASRNDCLHNLFRMEHDRSLLRRIVGEYARQRGWKADEAVEYVEKCISRFERKKRLLHLFK